MTKIEIEKAQSAKFPHDQVSDRVLRLAAELDPNDRSQGAEHLREVAGSIRDHRAAHPAAPKPHWGETQWAMENVGLN